MRGDTDLHHYGESIQRTRKCSNSSLQEEMVSELRRTNTRRWRKWKTRKGIKAKKAKKEREAPQSQKPKAREPEPEPKSE
jgi:hypothetical protein